jgi:hypothetical protein
MCKASNSSVAYGHSVRPAEVKFPEYILTASWLLIAVSVPGIYMAVKGRQLLDQAFTDSSR